MFYLACKYALSKPNSRIMYIFPTALQGRKAILEGVFLDNQPFITSVINEKHLKKPRNGSLYHYDNSIKFKNGSTISIVGDDGDTLVGSSINLLCISEGAMVSKETIDYLIPSVIKIKGKVIVVSSPRYGSHFNQSILENTGEILTSVIPANAVFDENGDRVYTDEELELAKSSMSIERFRSEYMVDLSSHNVSSIYGASFEMANWISTPSIKDRRIFISADLGINDCTDLIFSTTDNEGRVEVIHHYRSNGKSTKHYIDYIENWLSEVGSNKNLTTLILPHDSANTVDAGTYLTSRVSTYRDHGFHCVVLKPIAVLRAIEMTRTAIQTGDLKFSDNPRVRSMVQLAKAYEYKVSNGVSLGIPVHGNTPGAASNVCDALEYTVIAHFYDKYNRNIKTESGVIIRK